MRTIRLLHKERRRILGYTQAQVLYLLEPLNTLALGHIRALQSRILSKHKILSFHLPQVLRESELIGASFGPHALAPSYLFSQSFSSILSLLSSLQACNS